MGAVITHTFAECATVADMRDYLLHAHHAYRADSQVLAMVWEEQALKLTDDAQTVVTLGASFNITVNVVKKSAAADATRVHFLRTSAPTSASCTAGTPGSRALCPSLAEPGVAETASEGAYTRVEGSGHSAIVRSDIEAEGMDAAAIPCCPKNPKGSSEGCQLPLHASVPDPAAPAPHRHAALHSQPEAMELQQGIRVVVTGLVAKPEMNDCTGVICDAFDELSGRWTVRIESSPPSFGAFRPVNLKQIPPMNQEKEWLDEYGRQCSKIVNYAAQCPKGHSLVPSSPVTCQSQLALLCRICHRFAPPRLRCSVKGCCGGYAVCGSCADSVVHESASCATGDDLTRMGISLQYLRWLHDTFGASLGQMTTSQFEKIYLRPRTALLRCSVAHALSAQETTCQHVAPATWFVSHTWNNPLAATLQAILHFFEDRTDSANAMLWFDIFVELQHADSGPRKTSEWYMTTFKDSITNIGSLLLVVDVWNNPTALRRAWCVLELHAIALQRSQGLGEFAVAMTKEQRILFLRDIQADYRLYKNMLGTIDVEKSECSRREDRDSIHEGIRNTVGFVQLSRMVFGVLEEWIQKQLESQALACAEAGNFLQAIHWNEILGIMMQSQGMVSQAIAIQEKLLDLKRHVLPEHHSDSAAAVCNLATS